jgi:hypothetical protein
MYVRNCEVLMKSGAEGQPVPASLQHGAGNFAGEVELFYSEFARQSIDNKGFRIGVELALPEAVGEASRGSL